MADRKEHKQVNPTERKSVLTTFILLFPSMLIAMLAAVSSSLLISAVAIALFCYQAILLKSFVSDHYALE